MFPNQTADKMGKIRFEQNLLAKYSAMFTLNTFRKLNALSVEMKN